MSQPSTRIEAFRKLHESGCFVMPNPWDVGSARYLEPLGFKALATTSAGFAWSLGRNDNRVTLDEVLTHPHSIAAAVEVPVNADFEGGFAREAIDRSGSGMLLTARSEGFITGRPDLEETLRRLVAQEGASR